MTVITAQVAEVWEAGGEEPRRLVWWCPGCACYHGVPLDRWRWDGDLERPTLSPSVVITAREHCHCWIRGGLIEYLGDCSHRLQSATVEMEPGP